MRLALQLRSDPKRRPDMLQSTRQSSRFFVTVADLELLLALFSPLDVHLCLVAMLPLIVV